MKFIGFDEVATVPMDAFERLGVDGMQLHPVQRLWTLKGKPHSNRFPIAQGNRHERRKAAAIARKKK